MLSSVLFDECGDICFRDRLSVDADTLGETHQMRAGEQTHFESAGLQRGRNEVRGRTLTVGAGYMDGAQVLMRIAHMRHQTQRVVQTGLVCCCSHLMKRWPR